MSALTHDRVRELLDYDAQTGVLTWRVAPSNRVKVGDEAGTVHPVSGYRYVSVDGVFVRAHRLIVFWMTGRHPEGEVDHRDGVRLNNRWINLRVVSRSVNLQNQRKSRGRTSRFLGVSWDAARERWRATINVNGKSVGLGRFRTEQAAYAAYLDAKRKYHEGCTI